MRPVTLVPRVQQETLVPQVRQVLQVQQVQQVQQVLQVLLDKAQLVPQV